MTEAVNGIKNNPKVEEGIQFVQKHKIRIAAGAAALLLLVILIKSCGGSVESRIRNGVLPIDESTSIGDALDNYSYFSESGWVTFQDKQGRDIVQFTGTYDFAAFRKHIESKDITNSDGSINQTAKNNREFDLKMLDRFEKQVQAVKFLSQFTVSKKAGDVELLYSGNSYSVMDQAGNITEESGANSGYDGVSAIYSNLQPWTMLTVAIRTSLPNN